MQVRATQLHCSDESHYTLWDGEVFVTVHQNLGAHGFYSAAMVIERCDAPIEARVWSGYVTMLPGVKKPGVSEMLTWVAEQLTELSSGKELNIGGIGDVKGLLE